MYGIHNLYMVFPSYKHNFLLFFFSFYILVENQSSTSTNVTTISLFICFIFIFWGGGEEGCIYVYEYY